MANGVLELEPTTITATEAQDYMQSPSGQMLEAERQAGMLEAQRQMQNREQGLLSAQQWPGDQPASGFGAPGMGGRMDELYAIMAAGADDPTAVGMDYVKAQQRQQELDRANQPIEQFLKLYGNVNPFDWSAPSLQKFHDNYIKTGQLQFDLLEPKRGLTAEENKAILEADTAMYKAGSQIGQIGSLISRLDAAASRGDYTKGIVGSVDEWFTQNISGNPDDTEMIKQNYRDLKNQIVIQRLPPGVASDKDIAIAREGWPGPNVSPAYLASFLRGVQKMEVLNYAYQQHRSYYISQTQEVAGLSSSWQKLGRDFMADSLAANGLQFYNPKNPDGSEMTFEQASRHFYDRRGIGQQPNIVPQGGGYQGTGMTEQELYPSIQDPEPQREGESYSDYIKRKYDL